MHELTPDEPARDWKVEDVTVTEPGVIKRAIGAAAIGNVTEWYDFGVYAYFEPTIQKVFFSNLSDTMGTIATFATFAVAFLVRPFGGMFFGPLADRIGRNKVLATTMIMMALGTFAIGCIPNAATIGVLAPILLLFARLIQGFSTGGEYGNAMTFIAEYAPDRKRGFLGSWLEFGTFTGYLMGAIIVTVAGAALTEQQLLDWGWRIPFFVALPLGIVGVYLRTRLADTPAYLALEKESEEREKENKTGREFKEIFSLWPFLLVCMGLVLAWNVTNYMLTSYMPTYVTTTIDSERLRDHLAAAADRGDGGRADHDPAARHPLGPDRPQADRLGGRDRADRAVAARGAADPHRVRGRHLRRPAGDGAAADLLQRHDALDAAVAVPDRGARRRAVDRVQRLGLAVRGHHVGRGGHAGQVTGDLNWPGYYLIIAGIIGAVSVWFTLEPNGRRMWGSAPRRRRRGGQGAGGGGLARPLRRSADAV